MIIPPGFGQVALPFSRPGLSRQQFVVFGIDNNTLSTVPNEVANDVQQAVADTLVAQVDSQVTVGPAQVTINAGGGPLSGEADSSDAGESNWSNTPPNVAMLVRKITATPGRKGRGRLYFPWMLPDEAVDEIGLIDSTSLGVRQSTMNAFLLALDTNGVPMVVLHNDSTAPSPVTSLQVQSLIATQRRRLRK